MTGRGRTMLTFGAAALVVAVLVVYGGYGRRWSWLGINGHTATLWDWLHLVLLPLAAVALPLWLRHRPGLARRARGGLIAAAAAFCLLVAAGYLVPWPWTGFAGNTLWDWLNLAALPLAIALIPVLVELREQWRRHHSMAAGAAAVLFAVIVLAGYTVPWAWTGFTGNTVWDWLHLLLLPLLVPTVLVPVLRPTMLARMGVETDESSAGGVASGGGGASAQHGAGAAAAGGTEAGGTDGGGGTEAEAAAAGTGVAEAPPARGRRLV